MEPRPKKVGKQRRNCYIGSMGTPEREPAPIFDLPDEEAEERALAEAEAQVEAGQFISHKAMLKWLRSWGMPNELSPPKPGE